jgi:hypothetical protein
MIVGPGTYELVTAVRAARVPVPGTDSYVIRYTVERTVVHQAGAELRPPDALSPAPGRDADVTDEGSRAAWWDARPGFADLVPDIRRAFPDDVREADPESVFERLATVLAAADPATAGPAFWDAVLAATEEGDLGEDLIELIASVLADGDPTGAHGLTFWDAVQILDRVQAEQFDRPDTHVAKLGLIDWMSRPTVLRADWEWLDGDPQLVVRAMKAASSARLALIDPERVDAPTRLVAALHEGWNVLADALLQPGGARSPGLAERLRGGHEIRWSPLNDLLGFFYGRHSGWPAEVAARVTELLSGPEPPAGGDAALPFLLRGVADLPALNHYQRAALLDPAETPPASEDPRAGNDPHPGWRADDTQPAAELAGTGEPRAAGYGGLPEFMKLTLMEEVQRFGPGLLLPSSPNLVRWLERVLGASQVARGLALSDLAAAVDDWHARWFGVPNARAAWRAVAEGRPIPETLPTRGRGLSYPEKLSALSAVQADTRSWGGPGEAFDVVTRLLVAVTGRVPRSADVLAVLDLAEDVLDRRTVRTPRDRDVQTGLLKLAAARTDAERYRARAALHEAVARRDGAIAAAESGESTFGRQVADWSSGPEGVVRRTAQDEFATAVRNPLPLADDGARFPAATPTEAAELHRRHAAAWSDELTRMVDAVGGTGGRELAPSDIVRIGAAMPPLRENIELYLDLDRLGVTGAFLTTALGREIELPGILQVFLADPRTPGGLVGRLRVPAGTPAASPAADRMLLRPGTRILVERIELESTDGEGGGGRPDSPRRIAVTLRVTDAPGTGRRPPAIPPEPSGGPAGMAPKAGDEVPPGSLHPERAEPPDQLGSADAPPSARLRVEPLSTAEAPPPALSPAEGGPVWKRSELPADHVQVVRTRFGGTVVWVRTPQEAADPAAYRAVEHAQVPEGVVGVMVHADGRGAHVAGRWLPGDTLAAAVMGRLGVAADHPAPTVVLLSCEARSVVAREFAEIYPGDVYASKDPVWIQKAGKDIGRIITGRGVAVGVDRNGRLLAPVLDAHGDPTGAFEKVNHQGPDPAPLLPMPTPAPPDGPVTWSPLGGHDPGWRYAVSPSRVAAVQQLPDRLIALHDRGSDVTFPFAHIVIMIDALATSNGTTFRRWEDPQLRSQVPQVMAEVAIELERAERSLAELARSTTAAVLLPEVPAPNSLAGGQNLLASLLADLANHRKGITRAGRLTAVVRGVLPELTARSQQLLDQPGHGEPAMVRELTELLDRRLMDTADTLHRLMAWEVVHPFKSLAATARAAADEVAAEAAWYGGWHGGRAAIPGIPTPRRSGSRT